MKKPYILLALLLAGCGNAPRNVVLRPGGPPVAAPADGIDLLVARLGDPEWTRRNEATEALSRTGPSSLERLDRAAASDPDFEIRERARLIAEAIRLQQRGFTVSDSWHTDSDPRLAGSPGAWHLERRIALRDWEVPLTFLLHPGTRRESDVSYREEDLREALDGIRTRADLVGPILGASREIGGHEAGWLSCFLMAIDDPSAANAFLDIAVERPFRRSALFTAETLFPKFLARADAEHRCRLIEAFRKAGIPEMVRIGETERPLHKYLHWMGSPDCLRALEERGLTAQASPEAPKGAVVRPK